MPVGFPKRDGFPVPQGLEKIRVGVVGLGAFGSHHARHYAADPRARLVAVADADLSRACAAGETFGAEAISSHRGLIGKVDAVSITVPTVSHYAVARDLIDAGVHVFIEKPIAASAAEAEDLVERAAAMRATLQIGHIERFSPAFRALKGRIGDPRLIAAVRSTPWTGRALDVDVVLDLMIHDIDLAVDLAGAPVVAVDAVGTQVFSPTNDMAEARLTFANGVVATLAASRVSAKGERTLTCRRARTCPGRRPHRAEPHDPQPRRCALRREDAIGR